MVMQSINPQEYASLIRHLAHRLPYHRCEQEDLIQQGFVGLMLAARRFDPERGVRFSTYAVPFILGEMKKLCREASPVHIPRTQQGTLAEPVMSIPLESIAEAGAEDMNLVLAAALCDIPDETRQILILRHLHGMTQAEIGKRMGISQMEVSRRLRHISGGSEDIRIQQKPLPQKEGRNET